MEKKDKIKLIAGVSILAIAVVILGYQLLPSGSSKPSQDTAAVKAEDVVADKQGAKSIKRGSRAYLESGPSK